MKVQNVFYMVGVLFLIVAVIYFISVFIQDLPREIKALLLCVSVVVAFVVAELLRGGDK